MSIGFEIYIISSFRTSKQPIGLGVGIIQLSKVEREQHRTSRIHQHNNHCELQTSIEGKCLTVSGRSPPREASAVAKKFRPPVPLPVSCLGKLVFQCPPPFHSRRSHWQTTWQDSDEVCGKHQYLFWMHLYVYVRPLLTGSSGVCSRLCFL